MRNDLQALVQLWLRERKIAGYKSEYYDRKSVVTTRSESIRDCGLELRAISTNETLLEKRLEDLESEIDKLSQRVVALRKALSQGIVQDYKTAQGQIDEGLVCIDEREDAYIQILQDQEDAEQRKMILKLRLETDQRLLQKESSEFETHRVRLQRLVSSLREEQQEISETMNPRVVDSFRSKVQHHPCAVSAIVDGHCGNCRVMIPKMLLNDVLIREIVHTCPSCSTFLISDDV